MQTGYLFFAIYASLIFWVFPKITFIKNAGLSAAEVRILLALKMLGGIICAFYFENIFLTADYGSFNAEGKLQSEWLLSNPALFFKDIRTDIDTYGLGNIFDTANSFWGNIKFTLLVKVLAVFSLITGGNFYLNSAVFCSFVFFGHIAFYRIFSQLFKGHKLKILLVCFFIPSVVLYTSCVQKEGFVFLSLGMISFVFYNAVKGTRFISIKSVIVFLAAIITIFLFRNYVVIALLPAMITALFINYFPLNKRMVFFLCYCFYCILFFMSGLFNNSLNLPEAVVKRKAEFAIPVAANTNIAMNELYPNIKSFLYNLPQAINHSLFRPYLWEYSNPAVILTALEIFFYQLIFVAYIFFRNKKETMTQLFNLYGLAFFFTMMLIIGYTIPNIGAIVRYRSIFWIFLLCPLVCSIDWARLDFFTKKRSKKVNSKSGFNIKE